MLFDSLTSQLLVLLALLVATIGPLPSAGLKERVPLTWQQRQYYQSSWKQRIRFTTTPEPGSTPEPEELRKVYPCYCYKPPQPGESTTEGYEKYMTESKDIFILNK
ncbi:uncharacterized protein [Drosophila virilis]|uniref:Uncharacterized protein n=1 Tax=Drosophila virilis TaxID=7244 RepID=B4LMD1_DROVI|nr:uncharacterized protein LOC6627052 [Drosophila virilis]EDW62026.1 uncharacterized protein Dvir_GJ19980 [Drosophila virilis]